MKGITPSEVNMALCAECGLSYRTHSAFVFCVFSIAMGALSGMATRLIVGSRSPWRQHVHGRQTRLFVWRETRTPRNGLEWSESVASTALSSLPLSVHL